MSVTATTVGLGPFQPAVRWDGQLYIHPDKFKTEDEAIELANALVAKINEATELEIAGAYFIYTER